MKKHIVLAGLFLFSVSLVAQSDISGFVPVEYENEKLEKIDLVQVRDDSTKVLSSTSIDEKGRFHFRFKLNKYPKFYYLSINDDVIRSRRFFIKNNDSVVFNKSVPPLSQYVSNSLSDLELRKFQKYQERINRKKKYLDEIRTYSKDSLQILAVKLVSIKELDKKQLLDKDIALNKAYYSDLLQELKESEINPQEYLFLELKLTELKVMAVEERFAYSKWINILLGFMIIGLVFYMVKYRQPKQTKIHLSKQEQVIKDMILKEKSNKEIASELFISVSTVKTHITSIYQKLQVANRGDLIMKFKK